MLALSIDHPCYIQCDSRHSVHLISSSSFKCYSLVCHNGAIIWELFGFSPFGQSYCGWTQWPPFPVIKFVNEGCNKSLCVSPAVTVFYGTLYTWHVPLGKLLNELSWAQEHELIKMYHRVGRLPI
jgi:hypothetical protein